MNKIELRNIIGSNIRRERTARNMSLEDLAYHVELTSGFLGLIERGNRGATAYTIYKLAQIFDVTTDVFFPEASQKEKTSADSNWSEVKVLIAKLDGKHLVFVTNFLKSFVRLVQNGE